MRNILIAGVVLLISGCAGLMVSNLGDPPIVNGAAISIVDNRSADQKEPQRKSSLTPVAVLGDQNVQPPAIIFLQSSLQRHQNKSASLKIEIDDFAILDFFPKRLKAATTVGGWLTDAAVRSIIDSNTDWSLVNTAGIPDKIDSIVCVFSGKINGKPVKTVAFQTYEVPATAVSVRNNQAFTRAVISAIDKSAKDLITKVEN